jgi:hypothetical protein
VLEGTPGFRPLTDLGSAWRVPPVVLRPYDSRVIANDLQYRVTQRAARDFEESLAWIGTDAKDRPAWIQKAMRETITRQLADLQSELAEYDA